MSRRLISRSADLSRLRDEGYDIEVRSNYLLMRVPYVTAKRTVARGTLVSELTLSGETTTTPNTHVVHFVGAADEDLPCNDQGQALTDLMNERRRIDLAEGLVASCSFSHKPNPTYPNYYEKMSTYADMLLAYAQVVDREATAKTFPPIPIGDEDEDESVFRYLDSATSRAGIGAVVDRLRGYKIVIVGLGGTGSYILDAVAKTPVRVIHTYDRDFMLTHNAFRAPGAATLDELTERPRKVDYLQAKYNAMRRRIIAHPVHVDETNIDELRDADFVFLSIDGGPAKKFIIDKLDEFGVSFVDTGVGVYQVGTSLGGMVRTTASVPGHRAHTAKHISHADAVEDEYDQNIQVVELNMLNAALAVIKWKRLIGFYTDFEHELSSVYTIDGNHMLNEDQIACA